MKKIFFLFLFFFPCNALGAHYRLYFKYPYTQYMWVYTFSHITEKQAENFLNQLLKNEELKNLKFKIIKEKIMTKEKKKPGRKKIEAQKRRTENIKIYLSREEAEKIKKKFPNGSPEIRTFLLEK